MDEDKIYSLIDEANDSFVAIAIHFCGYEKEDLLIKAEKSYRTKFKDLNVNPSVVSDIYSVAIFCTNDNSIQKIKNNIESKLIKN